MPRVTVTQPMPYFTRIEVRLDTVAKYENWDNPVFEVILEKDIDYDSAPPIKGDLPPRIVQMTINRDGMTIAQAEEYLAALQEAIQLAKNAERGLPPLAVTQS